jgi:hypothetical protein
MEMNRLIKTAKEILQGFKGKLSSNPVVAEKARERASICADCIHNKNSVCSKNVTSPAVKDFVYNKTGEQRKEGELYEGCGCDLKLKVYSESTQCPVGKW